jgi:cytoskeletal protein RodZ
MEDMPDIFIDMSSDLDKADDNLVLVKDSMLLMSDNVSMISDSLTQYQRMIRESKTSTDNLISILAGFQKNLDNILNVTFIVMVLFFLWLLAFQVVIFSQGWELYRGTADGMASTDLANEDIMPTSESETHENESDQKSEESSIVRTDNTEEEPESLEN